MAQRSTALLRMLSREYGAKGAKSTKQREAASSTLMRLNRAAGRGASAQPWLPGRSVFKPQCRTPQRLFPSQPRSSPLSDHRPSNGADRLLVSEPAPIRLSWLANRRGQALLWHLCTASRVGFRDSEGFTRQLTAAVNCAKMGGDWGLKREVAFGGATCTHSFKGR